MPKNAGNSAYDTVIADAKYLPYLYHGTSSKNIPSIKKEGLKPKLSHFGVEEFKDHPDFNVPHVFVTPKPEEAAEYGFERAGQRNYDEKLDRNSPESHHPAIVKLHRNHPSFKGLKKDLDPEGDPFGVTGNETGLKIPKHIPPEAIHSIKVIKHTDPSKEMEQTQNYADKENKEIGRILAPKNKALSGGKLPRKRLYNTHSMGSHAYRGEPPSKEGYRDWPPKKKEE